MSAAIKGLNAALDILYGPVSHKPRTDAQVDADLMGERAERLDSLFERIAIDPDIPRCAKCGSRVMADETLCLNCTRFAEEDHNDSIARRRKRRARGPYLGGFQR